MFSGMQELGDYVPVNVTPPHPMCGHCLPDISSHRGCYPHTISQYHWWYIVWFNDISKIIRYIYNTQYHNKYIQWYFIWSPYNGVHHNINIVASYLNHLSIPWKLECSLSCPSPTKKGWDYLTCRIYFISHEISDPFNAFKGLSILLFWSEFACR